MTENYHIGQTFEDKYPPMAACWCNMNNAHIEKNGNIYTIVENPAPLPPTYEEVSQAREAEYARLIDPLHARKLRRTVLGKWTEEDESAYIAEVTELSAKIAEEHPYPEEPTVSEMEIVEQEEPIVDTVGEEPETQE